MARAASSGDATSERDVTILTNGRGPHGRVRPDVMCVEKGSEMILWVWSIGVLSYIPRVAYHLPNAY